ncbi:MAG: flagellar protein export ATPase FliI [Thiotrichales bacterium]
MSTEHDADSLGSDPPDSPNTFIHPHGERWAGYLAEVRRNLRLPKPVVEGRLTRMAGLTLEAIGCQAAVGERCLIISPNSSPIESEVVGFSQDRTFLMPTGDIQGILPGSRVIPTGRVLEVPVGERLLGRVVDATGKPLDERGPLRASQFQPLVPPPFNPLHRTPITEPLDVGVRAINAMLTVGRGQRIGLFAGSGVGKSVLLGMMTRYTQADIVVVGLIGERGREVNEFVRDILGADGLARSVVVAVPADNPPLKRLHGAMVATSIAEYFRDQGKNVLLLIDSLTRFAQAQREIALSIGEPPATKGYPPSVFAKLPALVERAGNAASHTGSITAFYTVLAEGDDQNDPIADAARAVLDGHIVLTRQLAESGHYPAIDIEASVSRLMNQIVNPPHRNAAQRVRAMYSQYLKNQDLVNMGIYHPGTNPELDQAIANYPQLVRFLQQDFHDGVAFDQSERQLHEIMRT